MGVVGVGKVGVGAEVDGEQVDDELDDLHGGQVTLPPDLSARGSTEVVVVHQHMDSQVQNDRNPGLQRERERIRFMSKSHVMVDDMPHPFHSLYLPQRFDHPIEYSREPW